MRKPSNKRVAWFLIAICILVGAGIVYGAIPQNTIRQDAGIVMPTVNATVEYYRGALNYTNWILGKAVTAVTGNYSTASRNSGANVGPRQTLNFIEGANITIAVADDGPGNEIDITITSTGGAGSDDLPAYDAVVSANASNTGRPRYYITDNHDDQVQIEAALADLAALPQTQVSLFIEPGFYNQSSNINISVCYLKDLTVFAYGANFFCESGRPNGLGTDDDFFVMLINENTPLTHFRWYGGKFDGNRANNPLGAANGGWALIYMRDGGHDVIFQDVYTTDSTRRGIMTKTEGGLDWYDVHYINCQAWNCDVDGLKFAIGSANTEFFASSMKGSIIGGEIGDIGISLFDQNDDGIMWDIGIYDTTIFALNGTGGTGSGGLGGAKWGIKAEATSRNIVIDGAVIYYADKGIGLNDGGSPVSTEGRHVISDVQIYMTDNSTYGAVHPVGTAGIVVKSDQVSLSNIFIIGQGLTSEQGISLVDSDNGIYSNINIENCTEAIDLTGSNYNQFSLGNTVRNGKGMDLDGTSDFNTISHWTFADTEGIEISDGCEDGFIIGNDFRQSTTDVDDQDGTPTTEYWYNWDQNGNFDQNVEP